MKPKPLDERDKHSLLGGEILLYPVYGKTPRALGLDRHWKQLMLHDTSAYRSSHAEATWTHPRIDIRAPIVRERRKLARRTVRSQRTRT